MSAEIAPGATRRPAEAVAALEPKRVLVAGSGLRCLKDHALRVRKGRRTFCPECDG